MTDENYRKYCFAQENNEKEGIREQYGPRICDRGGEYQERLSKVISDEKIKKIKSTDISENFF